jgi:hypothetical protein
VNSIQFYFARIALSKFSLSCMHFFILLLASILSLTLTPFLHWNFITSLCYFFYSKLCFSYFFRTYIHCTGAAALSRWLESFFFRSFTFIYWCINYLLLYWRLLIFMTPEDRTDYSETCVSACVHWLQVHSFFEVLWTVSEQCSGIIDFSKRFIDFFIYTFTLQCNSILGVIRN